MKLAVILPGELPEQACSVLNNEFSRFLSPGTQTAIIGLKDTVIEAADDIARLTPPAIAAAKKAEKEGFDGIVFNGT
jgi:hypothetical protein